MWLEERIVESKNLSFPSNCTRSSNIPVTENRQVEKDLVFLDLGSFRLLPVPGPFEPTRPLSINPYEDGSHYFVFM